MDKTAIRNFAVWARRKLIEDIQQKAYELGITEKDLKEPQVVTTDMMIIGDRTLNKAEMNQRKSLVLRVKEKGFGNVVEEVAYTWFNRFIALRFMEVNEYLPTGVRVLSSIQLGKIEPDIIKEALNIDLDLDRELVYRLQDSHDSETLYRYLLVKQCNALNEILPGLFEEIEDYTELLLPLNLLADGSVIRQLVESISEEDFKEQVEIIGWMYQYYITDTNELVYNGSYSKSKIPKELLPAATQIFTPDWVVKYMVENSLGRLWLESCTDNDITSNWKYYIEHRDMGNEERTSLKPEEIKVIDCCMGSGHILVYAWDVLMNIYKSCGYTERDASRLILKNNLYGLDIDDRAYQLSYFAIMMKARFYNRRILTEGIEPNLCSIQESNSINEQWLQSNTQVSDFMDYFTQGLEVIEKTNIAEDLKYLIEVFRDAKEYGSILDIKKVNFEIIENRINELETKAPTNLFEVQYRNIVLKLLIPLIKQTKIMTQKYDVVVTNPPYLNSSRMSPKLLNYISEKFPDNKSDFSMMFYQKAIDDYCKGNGFISFITTTSWMFLKSFEAIRKRVIENLEFETLVDFGTELFEGKVGHNPIVAWVNKNSTPTKKMSSIRLSEYCYSRRDEKEKEFFNEKNKYISNQKDFTKIPGMPIAYWIHQKMLEVFEKSKTLGSLVPVKKGLDTGNNEYFLKFWFEVDREKFGVLFSNSEAFEKSGKKWAPHDKGGTFRKWYGNNEYVINWENGGFELKNSSANLRSERYYFCNAITWSTLTSGKISFRLSIQGAISNTAGSSLYPDESNILYYLALLNSSVIQKAINIINPTLNYSAGPISLLPVIISNNPKIEALSDECISISRTNWDSFELSWDFINHPLLTYKEINLKKSFNNWQNFCEKQFKKLKENEELLNKIFIEIYDLHSEVSPEVDNKDIAIQKANLVKDIKSFISYAVGCIFGRYSLNNDGLRYAGGNWDISDYKIFIPDIDNILPITDEEYFEDDIVSRFIEFLKITFDESTLEENLDYIADALGRKASETSRQTIRRYLLKDFYKDHVQTYQKKPIYWLFDSGKQDGFKALIYLHRYDEFTVAKVRTDYLHKLQKSYESEVKRLDIVIDTSASEREKANAKKKKEQILKQMEECRQYDQIIAHVANQRVQIDLDDGVSMNYAKFQGVEIPQGDGKKPLKADLLAKI